MRIVFEGPDGCGKTYASKIVAERLVLPWMKSPSFSSEYADELNRSKNLHIQEVEFIVDRIRHEDDFRRNKWVCDRYIWSGIAYATAFISSRQFGDFLKAFYASDLFVKPDLYILVKTPSNVCAERKKLPQGRIRELYEYYDMTQSYIQKYSRVFIWNTERADIDSLIEYLKKEVEKGVL